MDWITAADKYRMLDHPILALLAEYVQGEVNADELHAELQGLTWGDTEADSFAVEARRLIAEASSASWDDAALRDEIERILVNHLLVHQPPGELDSRLVGVEVAPGATRSHDSSSAASADLFRDAQVGASSRGADHLAKSA